MSLGSIFAAAAPSLIGGLFGGSGSSPYSAQQLQGINGALNSSQNLNGVGSILQNTGATANAAYNQFAPEAGTEVQQDINLLNQNPYTDSYSTALLNQANGNNAGAFRAAGSNLTQSLASRGLAGTGAQGSNSSALSGGLSGIQSQQAATSAGLQNNIATNAIQQRYSNLANAAQLAQQYSGQLYGQGTGALSAAGTAYDQSGQMGLGAAGAANNLGQQQAAQNNQYSSLLGSLGSNSGLMSILGLGGSSSGSGGVGSSSSSSGSPVPNYSTDTSMIPGYTNKALNINTQPAAPTYQY